MPVCVLTRVMSDFVVPPKCAQSRDAGTTRRATTSRACQLGCVRTSGARPFRCSPESFPSIARLAPLGCATGLTSRVGMRAPDRVGSASDLRRIWPLSGTYLPSALARIWRLYPLHFAHAIKKAERNRSVTTVPFVELASEGARKPLVLLVKPAHRRIIYDFWIYCLNRGRVPLSPRRPRTLLRHRRAGSWCPRSRCR